MMPTVMRVVVLATSIIVPMAAVWGSILTQRQWLQALFLLGGAASSAFCILSLVNEAREDGYDQGKKKAGDVPGYADRGEGWGDGR